MARLFYRRRRLLLLVIVLLLVAGSSALSFLPRKEDPTLQQRFSLVLTHFPGAGPERVEQLVTRVLEEKVRELAAFRSIRSVSRSGTSVLYLMLDDSVSDAARVWSRLRDKLSDASALLPKNASEPELRDVDSQMDAFTMLVALCHKGSSPGIEPGPHAWLTRLADELESNFRSQPETRHTRIFGAASEEVLIEISAERLANLGMTAAALSAAVAGADARQPAGQLRGDGQDLLIEVGGGFDALERIRELPIKRGPLGEVLRLEDVARVEKQTSAPLAELAMVDGWPAVCVAARMQPRARIDRYCAALRDRLTDFSARLPPDVEAQVIFDQSRYVADRMNGLAFNLLLGAVLVLVVIFLMMGWKSALLVGSALPLSCLCVLTGLWACGLDLEQMSLTGLILSLGLLIDNAIIMVDEVSQLLEKGHAPLEAVSQATRSLRVPLLGSTLTTVLAFTPLLLMPGGAGEFLRGLAIGVVLSLTSSLFVSLSIVPAVTAIFKSARFRSARAGTGLLHRGVEFPWLTRVYQRSLSAALRRPLWGAALAAILPLAGFGLALGLEEQFFPSSDRDQLQVQLFGDSEASFEKTWQVASRAREVLLAHPDVQRVHWFVGGDGPKVYYNLRGGQQGSAHYAQGLIELVEGADSRALTDALQVAADAQLPGVQCIVSQLEQGPVYDAPIEILVVGPDLALLQACCSQLRALLAAHPDIAHTRTGLLGGRPRLELVPDSAELLRLGLNEAGLAQQLMDKLEGVAASTLNDGDRELPVRVRVSSAERGNLGQITSLDLVPGSGRGTVPLSSLGEFSLEPSWARITRKNGERVGAVHGFPRAGVLPAGILAEVLEQVEASGFQLPPGYRLELAGEAEERNRAISDLLAFGGPLMVLLLATLVLSFNSFRMAGIITAVALFSVGLALASLRIFGYPFGFTAIVGTMGLVGIAVNDSIVVLAALRADSQARAGDPASMRAVIVRSTRHVLSTSVTTVAGFIPLWLDGGGFWPPLAVAIAGGVSGATLLALYFVPCAYLWLLGRPQEPAQQASICSARLKSSSEMPATS